MLAALRVLWRALVHFYDESLLLIRANVVWSVGSVPLFVLVLAAAWMFVPTDDVTLESAPVVWPMLLAGFLLLVVPSPFGIAVYALAGEIVRGETPEFALFWVALRRHWRRGLAMFAIGGLVLGALIFNAAFYLRVAQGWVQAISVLWLYAILYWITLQTYLVPLLIATENEDSGAQEMPERAQQAVSLAALYRRAAILALANPLFSLVLLIGTVLTMVLSVVAVPVYPLIAMAYVALVGTRALRQLRAKYLPDELADAEGAAE